MDGSLPGEIGLVNDFENHYHNYESARGALVGAEMSFSRNVLEKIQNTEILTNADSVRFHKIGNEVFEISLDGTSFLLSTDAGLDLSFRLAEFMAVMERD